MGLDCSSWAVENLRNRNGLQVSRTVGKPAAGKLVVGTLVVAGMQVVDMQVVGMQVAGRWACMMLSVWKLVDQKRVAGWSGRLELVPGLALVEPVDKWVVCT